MPWTVRGHTLEQKRLANEVATGRLSHAYLFVGPPGVGKVSLALDLARALNCAAPAPDRPCGACSPCRRIGANNHPDVMTVSVTRPLVEDKDLATRTVIRIQDIQELQRVASLRAYEGRSRVFILDGAESMSVDAANCLLKVLEEPPPDTLIILATVDEPKLPPTVLSRCRRVELGPVPEDEVVQVLEQEHGATPEVARQLARMSRGRIGWALQVLRDESALETREDEVTKLLNLARQGLMERFAYAGSLAQGYSRDRVGVRAKLYLWASIWRDVLLVQEGLADHIENIVHIDVLRELAALWTPAQTSGAARMLVATVEALEQNANVRLALEALMLRLPRERTRRS